MNGVDGEPRAGRRDARRNLSVADVGYVPGNRSPPDRTGARLIMPKRRDSPLADRGIAPKMRLSGTGVLPPDGILAGAAGSGG